MTERHLHWENVYSSKRETEVSWFQETPAISLQLIAATGLAHDAAIVDIGGGASRLVDHLLAQGFSDLSVLDLSPSALRAARERLQVSADRVEWIVADVTAWTPPRAYDLWHDRAAFHFLIDHADRDAYVARLTSALRPEGYAVIGTFALDGPEKCSGLPIQRYDRQGLQRQLGAAFVAVSTHRQTHRTPWDSTQSFEFTTFKRLP